MRGVRTVAVAAMCAAASTAAVQAQKAVATPGATTTVTATIQRVDLADRYVVLRHDDGSEIGVFAPSEFTRLNEIRAGDTVTITYYESIVSRLARRGAPRPPVSEEVAAQESTGALPGATLSHQLTERVTVKDVDRETPSIIVVGRNGRTVSRRVEHLSDLDGVKPGDRIDITYTEALLATISRAR